jgi:hypothetical protein
MTTVKRNKSASRERQVKQYRCLKMRTDFKREGRIREELVEKVVFELDLEI